MMYEHPSELVRIDTRKRMMKMDRRRSASMREREEKLETVDLSGKNLERLPTNPSFNLGIIFKLDLSNNNLQMIPESLIARLLNVVVLDVHSNQLKYLPNSIGCLSKLKILNVAGNNLESLPKTIGNCSSLEELNANFNRLTRLPDTIGFELINLKKLIVSSNKLVSLPVSTGHLTSLYHLDVRLNCLQSLPEDLENLTNLHILNVSQNFHHLKTLPYSIGLLLSLVELDISYNNITTLPDSMGCLGKLKELRVEGNPLVSPPPVVVEQGLEAMKMYLTEKMNNGHRSPGRAKKTTWIKKLIKYGSFSGGCTAYRKHDESVKFVPCKSYNSQKDVGIFSPWRLFSPKSHHSN